MATQCVTRQPRGFSLVEFLVAMTLSLMAIGLIGSVFISAQKVAHQRSKQLYLLQALSAVFQSIEGDIQRAGFDNYQGDVLTLTGTSEVIETRSSSDFGLAYYREMADYKHYRAIRYRLDGDALLVCEQGAQQRAAIKSLEAIGSCRSMLDEKNLKVTEFSLTALPLVSSSAQSSLWTLSMAVQRRDLSYSHHLTIDIKQRNWQ